MLVKNIFKSLKSLFFKIVRFYSVLKILNQTEIITMHSIQKHQLLNHQKQYSYI